MAEQGSSLSQSVGLLVLVGHLELVGREIQVVGRSP
jgi:hypothetical protein